MVCSTSLFSQLLRLVNRSGFAGIVRRHRAERHAKGFDCWKQFASMLFCQLAQAKSLREICDGLRCAAGRLVHVGVQEAPAKSTLAYANEHRPWQVYEELFHRVLADCRNQLPQGKGRKRKFRFKNKLLSLDSSVVTLCLSMFPWATYTRTKGGVKLHLLLDHDGYWPVFAVITDAKRADVIVARHLALPKGSIVAIDRGYIDYELFGRWTRDDGVYFVTRMKTHMAYEVLQSRDVPQGSHVRSDEEIRLTGDTARKHCPYLLRRIVVWDEEKGEELVFLTNHMTFAAGTIAEIYRDRWEIELFFKAVKQNLKIKTFVGTSENALRVQIWTALIAILLLKFLQHIAKRGWSLSHLVALLRWNFFAYKDLWQWIEDPFETPPAIPDRYQPCLPGLGLGQPKAVRPAGG